MTLRSLSPLLLFLCLVLSCNVRPAGATIIVVATNDSYVDRIAAFGPRLTEEGLFGHLIAVESPYNHGCDIVKPSHDNWIALIERGNCTFIQKVRNMQASGAIAVVVGDNEHNGLITMYAPGDTSDVVIPSVFVSQHQYRALLYLSKLFEEPMLVHLVKDDLLQWPLLDVLIVVVLSPAVMMIFIYLLWRVRQRERRRRDLAPPNVVESLPTKIFFVSKRRGNEPEECAICLEDYVDEDELRVLPCKHEFHITCIDGWLTTRKKFCPICKRDICESTEETPLLEGASQSHAQAQAQAQTQAQADAPLSV